MLLVRLLAVAAAAVGGYLAWVSLGGATLVGCGAAPDCAQILRSRWAYWMGIPISIPAVVIYGTLFMETFWIHRSTPEQRGPSAWSVLLACSVLIFAAAIWFLALQIFVIGRFCTICLIFHGLGFLTIGAVLVRYYAERKMAASSENKSGVHVPTTLTRWSLALSFFLLALFVGGQILYRPQTHQVKTIAQETKVERPAQDRRQLQIFGGQVKLDLREVPIIGPPDAPQAIAALLDYTCEGCRLLHSQLLEANKVFGDQLVVACLLAPLDGACNPSVTEVYPGHTNACEYARIGLALWQADRRAHAEFEKWFFSAPSLPSPDEARRYASQWVPALASGPISNEWVEAQLKQGIIIYSAIHGLLRQHAMPQLIIGTNITMGSFRSSEELNRLLEKELGLVPRGRQATNSSR